MFDSHDVHARTETAIAGEPLPVVLGYALRAPRIPTRGFDKIGRAHV